MYATSSAPQLMMSMLALQPSPRTRSEPFTDAPLLTLPPKPEGPGMVPSTPTTVRPAPVLALKPLTKKKLIWFPGAESVKIWLRSPQAVSSSALTAPGHFDFAQAGTSYKVTVPRQRPAFV